MSSHFPFGKSDLGDSFIELTASGWHAICLETDSEIQIFTDWIQILDHHTTYHI